MSEEFEPSILVIPPQSNRDCWTSEGTRVMSSYADLEQIESRVKPAFYVLRRYAALLSVAPLVHDDCFPFVKLKVGYIHPGIVPDINAAIAEVLELDIVSLQVNYALNYDRHLPDYSPFQANIPG
ncbi:hypothetical protein H7171_02545 [Candidatus Saccharibacteria bacterium]|nr:hypothetical protein [Candidatus Saccharibacteria bacterium]